MLANFYMFKRNIFLVSVESVVVSCICSVFKQTQNLKKKKEKWKYDCFWTIKFVKGSKSAEENWKLFRFNYTKVKSSKRLSWSHYYCRYNCNFVALKATLSVKNIKINGKWKNDCEILRIIHEFSLHFTCCTVQALDGFCEFSIIVLLKSAKTLADATSYKLT